MPPQRWWQGTDSGLGVWQMGHTSEPHQSLTAGISPRGSSSARAFFWVADQMRRTPIKRSDPHLPRLMRGSWWSCCKMPSAALFIPGGSLLPRDSFPRQNTSLVQALQKGRRAALKLNPALSSLPRSPAKAAIAPLLYFPGEKEILLMARRQLCQCFLLIPSTGSNFSCGKIHQS